MTDILKRVKPLNGMDMALAVAESCQAMHRVVCVRFVKGLPAEDVCE